MDKPSPVHSRHHAVQFYENDSSLFATVAGFLSQGLVEGHPAILIATAEHTAAILAHLNGRMIDVEKARALGELSVLDAHQTLAMFMVDGIPDPALFEDSIGRVISDLLKARSDRTLVRAYGEMVDVLWKDGREDAAIQLELLWNSLAPAMGLPCCAATRWEISSSRPTVSKRSAASTRTSFRVPSSMRCPNVTA